MSSAIFDRSYLDDAERYIEGVLSGGIRACSWLKLACQRQRDDLIRFAPENKALYYWNEKEACRVCAFIEKLTHTKGELAGTCIHLEPWQRFILTTAFGWRRRSDDGRRFRRAYVEVPRGNGKALALDTLIPTPRGFVPMGELQVGDQVYGSDGQPYLITAATEVMHNRPCYEVEFNTGEVIVADAEHQWVTDARYDRDRLKGRGGKNYRPIPTIKTTEEISGSLYCRGDKNHRIKVAPSVAGTHRNLELEPYMLGLWLGDGGSRGSGFTCADVETIERIRSYGYSVLGGSTENRKYAWRITTGSKGKYAEKNSFYKKLQRLNVLNNKHIPAEYMTASASQRLELLQGLMDTDGFISKSQGQCEFCQKNKMLARQVFQLVASLGLRPSFHEKRATCGAKDCGVAYRVFFHAYADKPVFKLSRKVDRLRDRPKKRGLQDFRQIVRCERVESVPVRCIEVDSPDHCYLVSESHIITHNSSLSSGVALYCLLADREPGAEVYSFATTRDQAKIVFNDAKVMAEHNAPLRKAFGLEVLANALYVQRTNSTFQAKSAEGSTLDGLNTHLAVIDELHAHKTRAVYDVVETSLGKRRSSLLWCITTAGFDTSGICYEVRTMLTKVLRREVIDETQFGVIYTIDEDDDWQTLDALEKANPNWGISVRPEMITSLLEKAKALPSAINNFKTKHLDIWCSASNAWMDMAAWEKCEQTMSLDDFEGMPCYIGLDLGAKNDVTAKVYVFPRDGKYYVFGCYYLPESAIERSPNSQYLGWCETGLLTQTGGAMTDLDLIEEMVREDLSRFDVQAIAYDPWNALQLASNLANDGAPMVECRFTVQNISDPMKTLEALVQDGKVVHNGDPVMRWMMANVVARVDAKDNIFPRKERPENKIDGPVALIMALSVSSQEVESDPFSDITSTSGNDSFIEW